MKTTTILGILIFSFLLVLACGEETTELRWENKHTAAIQDIKWTKEGHIDTTWDGTFNVGNKTEFKQVSQINGEGECVDDEGYSAIITFDDQQQSATLAEGESNTLIIDSLDRLK